MLKRTIWAVLLLAGAAAAQEVPASPRALLDQFIALTDEGDLVAAGRLFDLSSIPAPDRDQTGKTVAGELRRFLNRVQYSRPFGNGDGEKYELRTPDGDIFMERTDETGWRFSAKTRDEIGDLYRKVEERESRTDEEAIADEAHWLRDRMPAWLRSRLLLLDNWQWFGLLALAILGIVLGFVVRQIVATIGVGVARRRGAELERNAAHMRPFGLIAQAVLWMSLLQLLALPPKAYTALMLAARLVLMVGVVWSLCRVVDWIGDVFMRLAKKSDSKTDDLLVPMIRRALKIFVVAFGIVWIADNLDMDIAALVAGLGIGGVALALASKDTVENFFGTMSILADRPFVVGDWIRIGDIEGTVEEVGFRSSHVRTFYNSLISFPNAMLIRTAVDNLSRREFRRVKETLNVTCDTPPDKLLAFVEGIRELIRLHPYMRRDYYHVYFHKFGPSSLDVLVYCFLRVPDWATELRERERLLIDILRLASELGVEFAFPTQTLQVLRGAAPEHGDAARSIADAHRHGRQVAKGIHDRFTGPMVPPPVVIGTRPDDAVADDDGGGE